MKTMHRVRPRRGMQLHPTPLSLPRGETVVMRRRTFMKAVMLGSSALALAACRKDPPQPSQPLPPGVYIPSVNEGETLFGYLERTRGGFDPIRYRQLIGAANEYKEGDEAASLAAADATSRANARLLLTNTRIGDLRAHPLFEDGLFTLIEQGVDASAADTVKGWTMGELKRFLLDKSEAEVKAVMPGLSSDIIGCIVKLMSNAELIAVGSKLFNPLPGSRIGSKGYLGARIQPNSPTDHPDDIRWQVFNGWAFAVGDVLLGTNPVSSEVASVRTVENTLKDVLETFGIADVMPHCVLSHIDIQAEVEKLEPGSTALWFQSLGGTEGANQTFDVTIPKMLEHAAQRTGKYGLYFETGQGADGTNGHGNGFDMVVHESRKYGFARVLKEHVAQAQLGAGRPSAPWVHLNDVAGFIGPEVFRTREQLVRCCLEDIVMGKLHGLTLGLDVCSTLHMEVNLDDLDWCLEQIMPANPAYLMALPTKNDPMLSYLTTAFQDHVRLREKFGYKVDDRMWAFFIELGILDAQGRPTAHFGDPSWVYLQYQRRKGDTRSDEELLAEARAKMAEVRQRGVWLAEGHGVNTWDLNPTLDQEIRYLYDDAKKSIHAELPATFVSMMPGAVSVATGSKDREDYILHPPTGEQLSDKALESLRVLKEAHAGQYDVQLVISDGLNAYALTDEGHLTPYLERVRSELEAAGYKVAPQPIVVSSGRVRAGYHIGEVLFGSLPDKDSHRAVLHIIGERPGSGHHAYSVYITAPKVSTWAQAGEVDHDITRVVSGIADTALSPSTAAVDTVRILERLISS
ncbi:ethanolamine ammonia-lyase subunit EutB [Archangium lansingense]|uniref:Ethanolamine ammonia-lyase subunit EutB n=1 Tax=Archangium lansingense TaxID=2995310 RepID=A0ABT4AKS4_9BACT|nr:ethanolamine ammonia-lyase subunit EutB [Archangium lansinium]MCY1081906.1 ethanolamine ammonia-lyase subunit EutB [Archangium lansinium]